MKTQLTSSPNVWAALLVLLIPAMLVGQNPPCRHSHYEETSNDFFVEASSGQGAVGDIVAIDLSVTIETLRSPNLASVFIAGCFDGSQLELLPEPLYSPTFNEAMYISYFKVLGGAVGPQRPDGGSGFALSMEPTRAATQKFFASGESVWVATLLFRVKGQPGQTAEVRFCDDEFVFITGSCVYTYAYYIDTAEDQTLARSTRHVNGQVQIVEGEPTRPDPPTLPPSAKVYPEAPTAEDGRISFELSGGVVEPGAQDVPLDIYVTSNYEFAGFSSSLVFPEDQVTVRGVDQHIRPGAVRIDNQKGEVGIILNSSSRRIGAEGERVHLATLRVDLNPGATADEVRFAFEPRAGFLNWLAIRHSHGLNAEDLPISAEVEPIALADGLLKVQREPTALGDVNLDYTRNVTDVLVMLGDLFRGTAQTVCHAASDFNSDGDVNLSDPIGLAVFVFSGGNQPFDLPVSCSGP